MALQDYSKRPHAGGAKGIRVTGSNKFQKYFTQDQKAEAYALSEKLDRETAAIKAAQRKKAEPTHMTLDKRRSYATDCGVQGINMAIASPRGVATGWKAYLVLQVMDSDGVVVNRSRRVHYDDIDYKFEELLQVLKEVRGYVRMPAGWRTRNPPTKRRFDFIARQMRASGCSVDSEFLRY